MAQSLPYTESWDCSNKHTSQIKHARGTRSWVGTPLGPCLLLALVMLPSPKRQPGLS